MVQKVGQPRGHQTNLSQRCRFFNQFEINRVRRRWCSEHEEQQQREAILAVAKEKAAAALRQQEQLAHEHQKTLLAEAKENAAAALRQQEQLAQEQLTQEHQQQQQQVKTRCVKRDLLITTTTPLPITPSTTPISKTTNRRLLPTTPLHSAAKKGSISDLKELLSSGDYDVNATLDETGLMHVNKADPD